MTKVTVDGELKLTLRDLREHVSICEPSGSVVAHLIPAADYDRLMCRIACSQISDEELARRMREPGGKSLSEILACLPDS